MRRPDRFAIWATWVPTLLALDRPWSTRPTTFDYTVTNPVPTGTPLAGVTSDDGQTVGIALAAAFSDPDGDRLAFGGGYEPPYTMKTVDLASGAIARTEFPLGYPGEIKWSADSTHLAVSTYDPERRHHETYVVNPTTGTATFLLRGCIILWSPDGRFLAVHGEPDPGISIVDVISGRATRITQERHDTPWRWEP